MNQSSSSSTPDLSTNGEVDGTSSFTTDTVDMSSSENCQLTDNFGLLVQGILAAVAFSTLICK